MADKVDELIAKAKKGEKIEASPKKQVGIAIEKRAGISLQKYAKNEENKQK